MYQQAPFKWLSSVIPAFIFCTVVYVLSLFLVEVSLSAVFHLSCEFLLLNCVLVLQTIMWSCAIRLSVHSVSLSLFCEQVFKFCLVTSMLATYPGELPACTCWTHRGSSLRSKWSSSQRGFCVSSSKEQSADTGQLLPGPEHAQSAEMILHRFFPI